MTNKERFTIELTNQYTTLFKTDTDYAYSAAHTTPEVLAVRMVNSLESRTANKDGKAIKNACKLFNIKHTYSAIQEFLKG